MAPHEEPGHDAAHVRQHTRRPGALCSALLASRLPTMHSSLEPCPLGNQSHRSIHVHCCAMPAASSVLARGELGFWGLACYAQAVL